MRLRSVLVTAALSAGTMAVVATPASAAPPTFQLPFPCSQTWHGNSSQSSAHRSWEIDFNRGASASTDLGDTVVAAAAGAVRTASHQGSANGYGNLVKIEHAGGYFTFYAHLNVLAVKVGEVVNQGQAIGQVGNTSRPGNAISPHLHFEVRLGDTGYPGNIQPAFFNSVRFPYPDGNVTSRNCASPYDPAAVCGSGYRVIDSARLGGAGAVNLMWNTGNGFNCVVTLKFTSVGVPTATSAYLEPSGATRRTESGGFSYYAGPVAMSAPTCVRWGGATGGTAYNSPSEHC